MNLNEIVVFCDIKNWVWRFVDNSLSSLNPDQHSFIRLSPEQPIRRCWERIKQAPRIIVFWEGKQRFGGAIIEEILEIAPHYDITEQLIVLTINPTNEDIIYFKELAIAKVIKLRNRYTDLQYSSQMLKKFITENSNPEARITIWKQIVKQLDLLSFDATEETIDRLEYRIKNFFSNDNQSNAAFYEAIATIEMYRNHYSQAESWFLKALDESPNFLRAYNNLIKLYRVSNQTEKAINLIQKMQSLNKLNISRLVQMGEIHLDMDDHVKAEHYFNSALDRDTHCSRALNGLAEIKFIQNKLIESREYLSRSCLAYKVATKLNRRGIELVQKQKYEQALQHYKKAQYIIPDQHKGPMLFFNMGLCCSKWGKPEVAKEFLTIALIKEPGYEKAKKLLTKVAL